MAQAILEPLIRNNKINPEDIFAVVGSKNSISRFDSSVFEGIDLVASDEPRAAEVWHTSTQLLAVKPQQIEKIESSFKSAQLKGFSIPPLLISILAGVRLERLKVIFKNHSLVRAVPNTPCLVGSGLTGLSWGTGITKKERVLVKDIFSPISEIFELPEKQLDAFLALTSSGPAYVALITEALADGAVAAGLPRNLAGELANKTLLGSSLLLKNRNMHPALLKDMVASPGGTTIKALRHLEKARVRSALIEAVVLAAEKSLEISQKV